MIARRAVISGRVQGVGFRWHTQREARRLGVCGWVRNCHDSSVEVWMEGAQADVDALLVWLNKGPPLAAVQVLHVTEQSPDGSPDFEVKNAR